MSVLIVKEREFILIPGAVILNAVIRLSAQNVMELAMEKKNDPLDIISPGLRPPNSNTIRQHTTMRKRSAST